MSLLQLFKHLTKREWIYLAIGVIFIVGQVYLDLLLPDYMAAIMVLVQTPGTTVEGVLATGSVMLACALGSLLFACVTTYFTVRVGAGLARALRKKAFDNTISFSMEEINRFSTASLITRSTNDITQIQMMVAFGLQMLIKSPLMAVWAIMKISTKNWEWTATTGIAVVVLLLMLSITMSLVLPRFLKIQGYTDDLNRITRENLSGIRVVRAYNAESYQHTKFQTANDNLTGVNLFANSVLAIQMPAMRLLMSGLTLAIYWVGIYLINAAVFSARPLLFADMVAFSSYAMIVISAFMMLAMTFIMMPRAMVAVRRVLEVINTRISLRDGDIDGDQTQHRGEIVFDNVTFTYPGGGDPVLHDISFTVQPGTTVALIGSTGAGKTTLLNLIPRFYEATEGHVLVDGVDVRDYTQESLRNKIGYVSQKAFLFAGTVESNIAYGCDNPQSDEVKQAADIAQASEFIEELPEKYAAHVAQNGTNFSGGQRQRLSIARAVYKHPEIFLLDDSFSALDYRTDHNVRAALRDHTNGATVLIVAQRIGTIMDADQILVLDEGRIVGKGTHDDLLKTCSVYREIAESQLSEEEMGNVDA